MRFVFRVDGLVNIVWLVGDSFADCVAWRLVW